jgi:hypothetical protein
VLLAATPALRGKTVLEALKAGQAKKAISIVTAFGEQAA